MDGFDLLINHLPVAPCSCRSPVPRHWAVADLVAALGRPLAGADNLTLAPIERPSDER